MKKALLIILAIVFVLSFAACGGEPEETPSATPTPTPTPAPTPTPTPEPVQLSRYVVLSDTDAGSSDEFFTGVKTVLDEQGIEYALNPAGDGLDGAIQKAIDDWEGGIIVYYSKKPASFKLLEEAVDKGIKVAAFESEPAYTGGKFPVTTADNKNDVASLMNAAYTWEHHDYPVRLIVMMTQDGSPLDVAYHAGLAEGKIQAKNINCKFYGSADGDPKEWITKTIASFYPGMYDAILCETPEWAELSYDALILAKRDDVEVMCIGTDDAVKYNMKENPEIMAFATGINYELQGELTAKLLFGGVPTEDPALQPSVAPIVEPDEDPSAGTDEESDE